MDDCYYDETQFSPTSDLPTEPDELLRTYFHDIRGWIARINGYSMLLEEPVLQETVHEKQQLANGLLFSCDHVLQVTCWYMTALANNESTDETPVVTDVLRRSLVQLRQIKEVAVKWDVERDNTNVLQQLNQLRDSLMNFYNSTVPNYPFNNG